MTTTPGYVLMTAAYNEARFLPDTIRTVLAQSVRPALWLIVSDNSTDDTDRIAQEAAAEHDFIRFLHFENTRKCPYVMGGTAWKKVSAMQAALAAFAGDLAAADYDYLGILDADVTFGPAFYATLIARMEADPTIGIGGGYIFHSSEGRQWPYFANPEVVGGPIQFFRRATWERIDGYVPWGQEDVVAQMMARMHGWRTQSFEDLRVLHHKTAKEKARPPLGGKFHAGKMERAMGYHPLYSAAKCIGQIRQRPVVLGSLARLWGYTWAAMKGIRSELPEEVAVFNRRQQMDSLRRRLTGRRAG